jgi:hypothetical protein
VATPTIGIGGSPDCNGQILLIDDDMPGPFTEFTPKFVNRYHRLGDEIRAVAREYAEEVRQGRFPAPEPTYTAPRQRVESRARPLPALLLGSLACYGDRKSSSAVGDFQHLCGALANDNACCHRVAGRHAGHNGRVRNPEIVEPVHSEFAVHNRRCIPAHPGRAALVPVADNAVPDKVLQFDPLEVSRHHLAPCKGTEGLRVAYFTAKLDARQCGLDVVGMR